MAKLKNRHVLSLGVLQGTDKCHTHTQVWCTWPWREWSSQTVWKSHFFGGGLTHPERIVAALFPWDFKVYSFSIWAISKFSSYSVLFSVSFLWGSFLFICWSDGRQNAAAARGPVTLSPREPAQREGSNQGQKWPEWQGSVGQQGRVPPGCGRTDHRPRQRLEVPLPLLQERRR